MYIQAYVLDPLALFRRYKLSPEAVLAGMAEEEGETDIF
jgi:hypothetical protein